MLLDPRSILFLAILVGATGWALTALMTTWHRLRRGDGSARLVEMEERLRKVEAATSSLLVDVTGMREKERFMARLQASAASQVTPPRADPRSDDEHSPMRTQNIRVAPPLRRPS